MAANNFYLGITMGQANQANTGNVVGTTLVSAGPAQGTAADIELRIQTDPGTGANNIRRKDVIQALYLLIEYVNSGGPDKLGTFLPGI